MSREIYSYHMFMFPFTWNTKDNKPLSNQEFVEIFETSSVENQWQRIRDNGIYLKDGIVITDEKCRNYYSAYQFFNEAGRSVVFDEIQNDIVSSFKMKDSFLNPQNTKYVISLKNQVLELNVTGIYLKVFNTGIAVFYMDCENTAHRSLEQVKLINEYGRRVSLSFWPEEENGYKKCADKLSIECGGTILSGSDFSGFIHDAAGGEKRVSLEYISNVIRDLLNRNGKAIIFRAKKPDHQNEIQIRSILDGRMYVSCCIVDADVANEMKAAFCEQDNSFSEEQQCNIAELLNVDLEGNCSYTNLKERQRFLEEHLCYSEFSKKKGKLLGITEQACVKIIEPEINRDGRLENRFEINDHNHVYNQIILMGIAQRMAISNFQQEIARISCGIECLGKKIKSNQIQQIMELQERYVAFQSQFLLYEVTPQREGTYIYNKIRDVLNVEEENAALSSRLSGVYELVNINQGYEFNNGALILSLIAFVFTFFSALNDANSLGAISLSSYSGYMIIVLELIFNLLIVVYILKIKNKRKRLEKNKWLIQHGKR